MPKRKYTVEEKQIFFYNLLFKNGYTTRNTQKIIKEVCNTINSYTCQKIFKELIVNIYYSFLNLPQVTINIANLNDPNLHIFKQFKTEFNKLTEYKKQTTILPIILENQKDDILTFLYDMQDYTYGNLEINNFARTAFILHYLINMLS